MSNYLAKIKPIWTLVVLQLPAAKEEILVPIAVVLGVHTPALALPQTCCLETSYFFTFSLFYLTASIFKLY